MYQLSFLSGAKLLRHVCICKFFLCDLVGQLQNVKTCLGTRPVCCQHSYTCSWRQSHVVALLYQGQMIAQDKLEKERADAKNAVEEYVYDMRDKLATSLEQYITEAVACFDCFV